MGGGEGRKYLKHYRLSPASKKQQFKAINCCRVVSPKLDLVVFVMLDQEKADIIAERAFPC
jgi:hypothetical protein